MLILPKIKLTTSNKFKCDNTKIDEFTHDLQMSREWIRQLTQH